MKKNKVISHLKGDIEDFKEEAAEDRKLIKSLNKKKKPRSKKKMSKGKQKIEKVLSEFKAGELHSGSKKGPKVTGRKQALAIALRSAGIKKK